MATRKPRIDSVAGAKRLKAAIERGASSPLELDADEQRTFDEIVRARSMDSWSAHELRLAATLSKLQTLWERQFLQMCEQGLVIHTEKGVEKHPLAAVLHNIQGQIRGMETLLGLSAAQQGKTGRETRPEREASEQALDELDRIKSESLLA